MEVTSFFDKEIGAENTCDNLPLVLVKLLLKKKSILFEPRQNQMMDNPEMERVFLFEK